MAPCRSDSGTGIRQLKSNFFVILLLLLTERQRRQRHIYTTDVQTRDLVRSLSTRGEKGRTKENIHTHTPTNERTDRKKGEEGGSEGGREKEEREKKSSAARDRRTTEDLLLLTKRRQPFLENAERGPTDPQMMRSQS